MKQATFPRIRPAGDAALVVELGDRPDRATHRRVLALWNSLERLPLPGMVEAVPGYRGVLISWDPELTSPEEIRAGLAERLEAGGLGGLRSPADPRASGARAGASPGARRSGPRPRRVTIPVVYGGPVGPDLDEVAAHTGLSPDEVVRLHAAGEYEVWMLGFMPGFAYLEPLDRRLWTPRRPAPRLRVPAGSVGIGGSQTGIYAMESPGGWRVIGCTWVGLWEPGRPQPALLRPGDRVRFEPVGLDQAPPGWAQAAVQAFEEVAAAGEGLP